MAIQNGGAWAWGWNGYGQLGNGTTTDSHVPVAISGLSNGVTAIAAGYDHSLAVQNGNVWAWGAGGLLGDGTETQSDVPIEIDPTDLTNIIAVAASVYDSYALSADGSIWDWASNQEGELGIGSTTVGFSTPQHLLPPSGFRFTSISAGAFANSAVATLASVPEPTSLAIVLLASGGLLRRRRRA